MSTKRGRETLESDTDVSSEDEGGKKRCLEKFTADVMKVLDLVAMPCPSRLAASLLFFAFVDVSLIVSALCCFILL